MGSLTKKKKSFSEWRYGIVPVTCILLELYLVRKLQATVIDTCPLMIHDGVHQALLHRLHSFHAVLHRHRMEIDKSLACI